MINIGARCEFKNLISLPMFFLASRFAPKHCCGSAVFLDVCCKMQNCLSSCKNHTREKHIFLCWFFVKQRYSVGM